MGPILPCKGADSVDFTEDLPSDVLVDPIQRALHSFLP